jgi:hypothetical protein
MPGSVPMPILPPLFSPLHTNVSPQLQGRGLYLQAPGKIWSVEQEGVYR